MPAHLAVMFALYKPAHIRIQVDLKNVGNILFFFVFHHSRNIPVTLDMDNAGIVWRILTGSKISGNKGKVLVIIHTNLVPTIKIAKMLT